MKRAELERQIDERIKESVLTHADEHGWDEGWSWDWRMDEAENIVGEEICWVAPRNSYLTRRMAEEMARRFFRAGRLAKAFDEALKRAV